MQTRKEQIPELVVEEDKDRLCDVIPQLIRRKLVKSGNEFQLLLRQGEILVDDETLFPDETDRVLSCQDVLQIGKRKLIKIIK